MAYSNPMQLELNLPERRNYDPEKTKELATYISRINPVTGKVERMVKYVYPSRDRKKEILVLPTIAQVP